MGVAVQMEKTESANFEPWEFQALRLLGSEARMRMLWAMLDRPMSARELSQRLELHLGGGVPGHQQPVSFQADYHRAGERTEPVPHEPGILVHSG